MTDNAKSEPIIYVYRIQGVLEKEDGSVGGIRVSVCSATIMQDVDVPSSIFPKELLEYLKFRLMVNNYLNVQQLPNKLQIELRNPIGKYLDKWVKETVDGIDS